MASVRIAYGAASLCAAAAMGGCAQVPGMPGNFMLPVREIVAHAVCELRFALQDAKIYHPSFLAHPWAISITVTPKVDSEVSLRAGLTGKSSSVSVPFFNTWVAGAGPGAEYDMKGHTDGGVSYIVKSGQLLDDSKYPLPCRRDSASYHALASNLGIYDWLSRTAAAAEGDISKLTKIDKPSYNSQIVATWDGSGSFTYNQPFGTDFLGAMGSYKIDESVAILFTAEDNPPRRPIRTLPGGTPYSSVNAGPGVSAATQNRLDILGLQQSIVNLETAINRRR
ncbi:hypothetical protein [Bradyrhizobium sp. Ash2021]|uniref:hypothetical protein n=1 Tax=Bradyrhizobium sp. Ash2021 TaxID=2954771 RepID=UPI002815B2C8|nr:hypothetical protein [Bradyrhizobium sp. Ash2021]WMT76313.1 hypothetical protein NL528_08075 [Bradyrhizobium sp. Ash2021]